MKRTPLYETHRALGARMVDFAGWIMPVQYSGIIDEHRAVRASAGLFDVSHMGEIEVSGRGALAACQRLTVNDVARLGDGQAQYSMLCTPGGGVVDDVIVYRLAEDRYLFCVNASNCEADFAWMREHAPGVRIEDRSEEFSQLAMQGPKATEILGGLTELRLQEVPPFSFVEGTVAGCGAMVARTGYTGEDGWEIYCDPAAACELWDAILASGRTRGLKPVGLGARDTLRLESALPLYGHELSRDRTPIEAGLGWVVRCEKGDFLGRERLLEQKARGTAVRLVGLRLADGGVPRQGYEVLCGGVRVGEVTSGTKSPTLGWSIALAYVGAASMGGDAKLAVGIRGKAVPAEVVKVPFYRRPRGASGAGLRSSEG